MSYYAYNEKLNVPQVIGIVTILLAVVFMGVFQDTTEDVSLISDGDEHSISENTAILLIILYGSLAALAFSVEAMLIRWGVSRGVPGDVGGYLTLFFDGLYGTIILIILAATGNGWQVLDSSNQVWLIYAGGIFTSMAIVLVNYSVANGIAGISFSVANSFPAWHAIFNYFVFSQIISGGQVVGIVMAVSGGIVLSLS
eukprot:CAMPEP_0176356954 /NCGR_PEP_ID=MMETSP0126-20121128/14409_1 /TAXON_ID=141414 ORGANISM="Strombidinopsis acuminatum, Strain SPMC142" /NCGR_SAMPLE_ID=MMETSP0126 /ASSEMBLY_ACC=CAM_ASM_000229 /LENGTH=197 /DNA_ID=CAMNT_0017710317 /DNA_START=483 /DNA_END=1076 /DNA_ORIENTATION=+